MVGFILAFPQFTCECKSFSAGCCRQLYLSLIVMQLWERCDVIMATCSYTAEFGAGVVVNGLDLNKEATKVLVGGRKGRRFAVSVVLLCY